MSEESGFNIKNFNEEYGFSCSSNTYSECINLCFNDEWMMLGGG